MNMRIVTLAVLAIFLLAAAWAASLFGVKESTIIISVALAFTTGTLVAKSVGNSAKS